MKSSENLRMQLACHRVFIGGGRGRFEIPDYHTLPTPPMIIGVDTGGKRYLDEPGEPEYGVHADFQLDEVEWRERRQVEQERPGPDVVAGQLPGVVHHQTLFQVTGAELHGHVQQEHDVAERVHGRPPGGRHALQLGQALPDDGRPQVVQRAAGQHHQPVEVEVLVRVDHRPRQLVLLPAQPALPAHVLDVVLRTGTALAVVARVQRLLRQSGTR